MITTYKSAAEIPHAQFGLGARDTRWDVRPKAEPVRVVAQNRDGLWIYGAAAGVWYRSPAEYLVYAWDLTAEDAERMARETLVD